MSATYEPPPAAVNVKCEDVTPLPLGPQRVLHQQPLESALEQGPDPPVPAVEPRRVANIEPLDGPAQVGLRYLHHQMVMIAHQHVSVHLNPEELGHLREEFQEMKPVPLVVEEVAPLQPTGRHMIPAIRPIYT